MASENDPSAVERQAARAALRAIDPDWPADAASQDGSLPAAEQMQATLAALRGWQASLADLPPVAVPRPRARVYSWPRWTIPMAAAAVLLMGVGLWMGQQPLAPLAHVQPPLAGVASPPPPPTEELDGGPPNMQVGAPKTGAPEVPIALADSSQWLADAPPPEAIGKVGVTVGSEGGVGSPPGGNGPKGSNKPPRGTGSGGTTEGKFGGVGKGGIGGVKDAGETFLDDSKLDFSLRIPMTLTGGWTFLQGKALSPTRAQLTYTQDDRILSVLVWKDPGENSGPHEKDLENGRRMLVVRRGSVGVAFEGPMILKDAGIAARHFAPAKR